MIAPTLVDFCLGIVVNLAGVALGGVPSLVKNLLKVSNASD